MKRTGNLIEAIADPDNLRLAFWKARKGKNGQADVIHFRRQLDQQLLQLREELLSGQVQVGDYHYFTIYDPKERVICAAAFRERVLHHALMNVCHPVFERFQLDSSYATRPGKGTYVALDKARHFHRQHTWFLQLDIRKYFDSIDQNVLLSLLKRKFKDRRLLGIFEQIITSYRTGPGRGLPIGNLTSQYFANYYLAFVDHYLKEQLGQSAYVRYMDDLVCWHSDKQHLLGLSAQLEAYLNDQLHLQLKICRINRTASGLNFLGYRLRNDQLLLAPRSKQRFRKKLEAYTAKLLNGQWNEATFQAHVLPLLAYAEKAETYGYRQQLLVGLADRYPGL